MSIEPEPASGSVNILLVDDRPENLLALEAVLQQPRYTLIKVSSGHEALDQMARMEFALILLDVQMPEMDGFETARRIRQDARSRDIPILFITAMSKEPMHVFRGYESGAIDYLTKPFDDYVLRSKVAVIAELYEKNRQIRQQQQLIQTNIQLQQEILERKHAEAALRLAQNELEQRVLDRTAALAAANDALQLEITERRETEHRLQASLREKEVLLKEIHHRVKNNLQVVSSLLSLQSDAIKDPVALSLFEESRNRIRSMALVHEELYGTKDLSSVDMSWYIHGLATHLLRAYGMTSKGVDLRIDAEGVPLMIDAAIPCGLMLNELISNALKHAFPNGRQGQVRILLQREPSDFVVLIVEDDGIGIPEGITIATSQSLGLRLVSALADQLQASVALDRAHGTRFTIRFLPQTPVRTGSLASAMDGASFQS